MIHPKRPEEEPTRKALAPWTGFESLRKEMERFFDRFGGWEFPDLRSLGEWSPKVDFSETKDGYGVKAEIPGIEPKDIEVSLENQALTIKGEEKQEKEQKDEQFYRTERSHGVFVRTIRLPGMVDGGKVTASRHVAKGARRQRQRYPSQVRVAPGRNHGPARSEWKRATMKRRERLSIALTTAEKRKGLSHDTGDQEE